MWYVSDHIFWRTSANDCFCSCFLYWHFQRNLSKDFRSHKDVIYFSGHLYDISYTLNTKKLYFKKVKNSLILLIFHNYNTPRVTFSVESDGEWFIFFELPLLINSCKFGNYQKRWPQFWPYQAAITYMISKTFWETRKD